MFKQLFHRKKLSVLDVVAPVSGKYLNLDEVPDPVFSERMVGDGVAIQPEQEKTVVVSPVKGKIVMLADTNHAIGIQTDNGLELLIHIGLDTVELKGNGFHPLISIQEHVEQGQPMMEVDVPAIEASGKKSCIPIVITNNENGKFTLIQNPSDTVEAGETVLFSVE